MLPETPRTSEAQSIRSKFPSFSMGGAFDDDDEGSIDNKENENGFSRGVSKMMGDRGDGDVVGDAFVPPRGSAYVGRSLGGKVVSVRSSAKSGGKSRKGHGSVRSSGRTGDGGIWSQNMSLPAIEDEMLDLSIDDRKDEDGLDLFDAPDRLTIGPGAAAARLDLQRCTIKVHQQLVDQLGTKSMNLSTLDGVERDSMGQLSRAQGELFLKSRVPLRGWRRRYGSIVDHSYFGPVLFLFKYDSKGNVALHHSMMIVLVESQVRLGKNTTARDGSHRCEFYLKTSRRKYCVAATHTMRRDYWLSHLEGLQAQINTTFSS